jgi:virulence-associated protein VagC
VQNLTIHYNCAGSIVIPEEVKIPNIDVTINTRKGVDLTYEPLKEENIPLKEVV